MVTGTLLYFILLLHKAFTDPGEQEEGVGGHIAYGDGLEPDGGNQGHIVLFLLLLSL